jgi:hypothetical protein
MNSRTMPEATGAAGFMTYNLYRMRGDAVDRLTVMQHPSGMRLDASKYLNGA